MTDIKETTMAVNLTSAINADNANSPIPLRAGLMSELWVVTGASSSAADTGTLTPKFITSIIAIIGASGFTRTISGSTITFTDKIGIGSTAVDVMIIGR